MRVRDLHLTLDGQPENPLYLRVAGAIVQAIREGRVAQGAVLPGVRELAERLSVHRNTALAALRELEAQGWVEARPRMGYFVRDRLPERPPSLPGPGSQGVGFDLPSTLPPLTDAKDLVMDLSDGVADARLAPTDLLARAYQRGLRLKGPQLLGGGEFKGVRRLRDALAFLLAKQRALRVDPDQLLVIRSTSMAVTLVAQSLLGSTGAEVAVEDPGHPLIWDALRHAGAKHLHGIPVDAQGLRVDALETLLSTTPLRLLVITPRCHYPTGVPLALERRKALLRLAQRHRLAILELDPEHDFLQGATMPPPLAAQDATGQVIYVGSLSRAFGPGLRMGFITVPEPLANVLAKARQRLDWQGEPVLEWAMSELILDGDLGRHLRRVRTAVIERREALEDALNHTLSDQLRFTASHGAMALWIEGQGRLAQPERFDAWVRACGLRGLKLRPGNHFTLDGRNLAATRLGYTAFQPEELQRAVALMG
jgi:GntR family transcriptional regulator/MocR family aminotransferase